MNKEHHCEPTYVFLYIKIYEKNDFHVLQAKLAAHACFCYVYLKNKVVRFNLVHPELRQVFCGILTENLL